MTRKNERERSIMMDYWFNIYMHQEIYHQCSLNFNVLNVLSNYDVVFYFPSISLSGFLALLVDVLVAGVGSLLALLVPCVVPGEVLLVVSPPAAVVSFSGNFLRNLRLRLYLFPSARRCIGSACCFVWNALHVSQEPTNFSMSP